MKSIRMVVCVSKMAFAMHEPSQHARCATSRNEDYALALVDGAFTKALEVHLVRKVPAAPSSRAGAALRVLHGQVLHPQCVTLNNDTCCLQKQAHAT